MPNATAPMPRGGYPVRVQHSPALNAPGLALGDVDELLTLPWEQITGRPGLAPEFFGAFGDDTSHPLSETYSTLAEAQVVYPTAVSLSDETDTVAWEKLITATIAAGGQISVPDGVPVYQIMRELVIPSSGAGLVTSGGQGCELKAVVALRSVLVLRAQQAVFEGIVFNANALADYGLLHQGSALSRFKACKFIEAKLDGEHLAPATDAAAYTINDNVTYKECWWHNNGTLYYTNTAPQNTVAATYDIINSAVVTGTVSVVNGGYVVTGVATAFLSMGLRKGDFICIGYAANDPLAQFGQVSVVNSDTQITCGSMRPFTATLNNVGFFCGKGAGHFEALHSDNNINRFEGGWSQANCTGFNFQGLYGPRLSDVQIVLIPFYGIVLGILDTTGNIFQTVIDHGYSEAIGAATFLFANAMGVVVSGPLAGGDYTTYHDGGASFNYGVWQSYPGLFSTTSERPIGNYVTSVPVQVTYAGAFLVSGKHQVTYDQISVVAGVSIPCTYSAVSIFAAAPVTLNATPQIAAPADPVLSEVINLLNTGAETITLRSNTSLGGAAMTFGAGKNTLAIASAESATFRWHATAWYLTATTGTIT